MEQQCKVCGTARQGPEPGQWWHLTNYFGFSGNFCPDCYEKVSHNSYGQPNHPNEYLMLLLKR